MICKIHAQNIVKNVLGLGHLGLDLLVVLGGQGGVVVTVGANLMSFLIHTADGVGVVLGAGTQHKEGCLYASGLQTVKELGGVATGAVVKGDSNELFTRRLGRSRNRQAGQQGAKDQ